MYLRASEMSKQAWSEAVKTNNLEEHMLLDPLYYSFGDKEQKCWGVQVNVGGAQNMLGGGGGARMKLGGVLEDELRIRQSSPLLKGLLLLPETFNVTDLAAAVLKRIEEVKKKTGKEEDNVTGPSRDADLPVVNLD